MWFSGNLPVRALPMTSADPNTALPSPLPARQSQVASAWSVPRSSVALAGYPVTAATVILLLLERVFLTIIASCFIAVCRST